MGKFSANLIVHGQTLISPEFPNLTIGDLSKKIGLAISNDIRKNKKTRFKNVKGKQGQNRKGMYQLKRQKKSDDIKIAEAVNKSGRTYVKEIDKERDRYTGKAGEFAVISELLFRQYNASLTSLDNGIDIIALKDGMTYYIQAKTDRKSVV